MMDDMSDQEKPRLLSAPGISPALWGVLEAPDEASPHPGIILLPGSNGWRPAYAAIAKALAEKGYAALAVDYLAELPASQKREENIQRTPTWQANLRSAVEYLKESPHVGDQPIGIIGYSLGAFLAVSTAGKLPEVKAVVEFFGGGRRETLEEDVRGFPPLLILHGEADSVVPVSEAYHLREAVAAQGGEVEMQVYPEAGHSFNAPWSPNYSEAAAKDSTRRMLAFLDRYLRK